MTAPLEEPFDAAAAAVQWHALAYTRTFWDDLAARLLTDEHLAGRIVLVPHQRLAATLSAALWSRRRMQGAGALLLPRITTLERWSAEAGAPLEARSETARRIELYRALRQTGWIARHWAHHEGALWGLTRDILALCDRLTFGLSGTGSLSDAKALATRFLAVVKGTYSPRAFAACSAEAELVDTVWRATLSASDGAARHLLDLAELAARAARPLTFIALVEPPPYLGAFLQSYARRQEVQAFRCDIPASLGDAPLYTLAWPELLDPSGARPIERACLAERARDLATAEAPGTPDAPDAPRPPHPTHPPHPPHLQGLSVVAARSLEEGAVCAAERVVAWLAEGRRAIGIIALDRAWARRVRALLERAAVLACDEAGWKLSTTIVGGALMRWLDISRAGPADCEVQQLLDWLKSAHALGGEPNKEALLAALELAARRGNVVRGWAALDEALAREAWRRRTTGLADDERPGPPADTFEAARDMLKTVRQLSRPLEGRRALAEHFAWLAGTLRATGMQASFERDVVGQALLAEVARLALEAGGAGTSETFTFEEWREFVGDALESATFRDAAIESPVVITSLREAAFRPFDGLVLLGASRDRLPQPAPGTLFLSDALAVELGVRDPLEEARADLARLATLFATTPAVLAVGLGLEDGETVALAAPLERLALAWRVATGGELKEPWDWPRHAYRNAASPRPRPSAARLVPTRLSASAYRLLVECPYRFFVHRMLELEALEDISDEVEKRHYGEIVHAILERFHGEAPDDEPAELAALRLRALGHAAFQRAAGSSMALLGYEVRWNHLVESYLDWWRRHQDRGWRFAAAEAERAVELELADGARVTLHGRIDRIDVHADGAIAIIDYKARNAATLRASLKEPGEDVQLPFYRLLEPGARQARAIYLSVDADQVVEVASPWPLDDLAAAVADRLRGDLGRLRAGAALPAHGAESACRYCEARGLCRKDHWPADGAP